MSRSRAGSTRSSRTPPSRRPRRPRRRYATLGLLTLLGKVGDDKPAGFDPAVGSCVKQSGETAVPADCGEQGAFSVVSKVDNKDKCADLTQPTVSVENGGTTRVLCLKPAGQ